MTKGIIYVRVSSNDQTQGTSLDTQKRACIEYAKRNEIDIVQIFVEKGESATAANRTEFLKALDFCRQHSGEITAFIVWKIDRFARNTTDHFAIRAKLTKFGVALQSVTEPITQDHMGKLMETFLAGYAEFENEVRKQRCTSGMQARLREGIWCWSPPLGYKNSKKLTSRRKTMPDEPDETRFDLIQKGLRLYMQGRHTISALALEAKGWGLLSRTGRPVGKQHWERILSDKFYAGIVVDPWDGKEHVGQHRPMITTEEFEKILNLKKGNSNKATKSRLAFNPDFPLRGLVLCECGKMLTAAWSKGRNKRYPFYSCHNRKCVYFGLSITRKTMESQFHDYLKSISPSEQFISRFKSVMIDCFNEMRTSQKEEKLRKERELEKLRLKRQTLLDLRMTGEISQGEFSELRGQIGRQIESAQQPMQAGIKNFDVDESIKACGEIIMGLAEKWLSLKPASKQRFQKAVLPKNITYERLNGTYRTAILPPILRLNELFLAQSSDFVAEVGQNLNQILPNLAEIADISELSDN